MKQKCPLCGKRSAKIEMSNWGQLTVTHFKRNGKISRVCIRKTAALGFSEHIGLKEREMDIYITIALSGTPTTWQQPPRKKNFPAGTRCVKMPYEARELMDVARERDWDWPQYVTKVW